MLLNKTCSSTPLFLQVLYLEKKNICRSSAVCRGTLRLSAEGDPGLGYFSFGDAPRLPALPAGSGARWMLRDRLQLRFLAGAAAGEPGQRSRVGAAPALSRLPRSPRRGPALSSALGGAEGGREGKAAPRR